MTIKPLRTRSTLESASHIAVLLASVAIIVALTWGYFVQHAPNVLESGLHKGEVLDIPSIDLGASDRTLLIALSTTCRFCGASMINDFLDAKPAEQ